LKSKKQKAKTFPEILKCKNCKYWVQDKGSPNYGSCLGKQMLNSIIIYYDHCGCGGGSDSVETPADFFCSEFKEKLTTY